MATDGEQLCVTKFKLPKPCEHPFSVHTRMVVLHHRLQMQTYGCTLCGCNAFTKAPETKMKGHFESKFFGGTKIYCKTHSIRECTTCAFTALREADAAIEKMKVKVRDEAVAFVDRSHGYTMEFASSPAAHRAEYDEREQILLKSYGLADEA